MFRHWDREHPPESPSAPSPLSFRRGDNASARYKPEHGVHLHGLLRGLLGAPELAESPFFRSGPSEATARVLLIPSGRAEKRRAWGGHGLRSKPMLRALTRCGCLSGAPFGARSEFRSAAPGPSIAGCPQRSEGTRQVGSPFFGESKKETAPPGAHPGLQRHQRHYAFNSCLRPPRLVKTLISFKKPRAGRNCGQARARAKGAPQDKPAGD